MTAEHSATERAIRAKHGEFARLFGAGDAFRLVDDFYAWEAHMQPPDAPPILGRAGIRALFETILDGGPATFAYESECVESSGDLAYASGAYTMVTLPPSGEPVRDTGRYREEFRRQADGTWKCVAGTFSRDPAPR